MVRKAIGQDVLVDPNYSPDKAVLGYSDSGSPESRSLAVVFPAWRLHLNDRYYRALGWCLGLQGFAVRRYDFNDHILEPDVDQVVASYKNIRETVTEELETFADQRRFNRIHFIASSLGTVSMALVASSFDRMTSATIASGSSNLALSVWHGIRTREVRRALEEAEEGCTARMVDDKWHDIAPMTHASAFENKPTRMIISTTDAIIPTIFQREMADALADAGSQVSTHDTTLGHYASIGAYFAVGRLP